MNLVMVNQEIDIVVMLQGDEPMTIPEMIDMAVHPLINDSEVAKGDRSSP